MQTMLSTSDQTFNTSCEGDILDVNGNIWLASASSLPRWAHASSTRLQTPCLYIRSHRVCIFGGAKSLVVSGFLLRSFSKILRSCMFSWADIFGRSAFSMTIFALGENTFWFERFFCFIWQIAQSDLQMEFTIFMAPTSSCPLSLIDVDSHLYQWYLTLMVDHNFCHVQCLVWRFFWFSGPHANSHRLQLFYLYDGILLPYLEICFHTCMFFTCAILATKFLVWHRLFYR